MPPYGSLNSPSVRKMNGHMEGNQRGGRGFSMGRQHHEMNNLMTAKCEVGYIFGDPFALATISIAYVRLFRHKLLVHKEKHWLTNTFVPAGLVDSLYCLNYCRHPIRFSQLRMVGYRILALLRYRSFGSSGFGLGTDVPCRRQF